MLLVFSHAAVLDVNRAVFRELAQVADIPVKMIVPQRWQGDLIQKLEYQGDGNAKNFEVYSYPVVFSGRGSFFFYRSFFKKLKSQWTPQHVFVDEEPWSVAAFQAFEIFQNSPRSFFTKQNLLKKIPPPFYWMQKRIFSESTHAYSVAEEVTQVLRQKGYQKEIRYLPHSYDPNLFKPLTDEEKSLRKKKLGIPDYKKIVSYFGRLADEKGIHDFLGAIEQVEADCLFLIVGNGPLEKLIHEKKQSKKLKEKLFFFSAIPHHEVGGTLALSDVLILPSRTMPNWKEQFGRILVEAMACGAAVVGSDSGEIPNLIKKTGGGFVFQERNVSDLKNQIETLLSTDSILRKHQVAGQQYVFKNLTHTAVAKYLSSDLGF